MGCDGVGVLLPDSDGRHLRLVALDFPNSKGTVVEEITTPINEDMPLSKVFRSGKPGFLNHQVLANLNDPRALSITEGVKALGFLPLLNRNRVLGVLGVARLEDHPFSQDDSDFFMQIASQVAIAVDNALAYGEITALKNKLAQEKSYLED